jgi:hypothetical protein
LLGVAASGERKETAVAVGFDLGSVSIWPLSLNRIAPDVSAVAAVSKAYERDIQMIDSSGVQVRQYAAIPPNATYPVALRRSGEGDAIAVTFPNVAPEAGLVTGSQNRSARCAPFWR